MKSSRQASDSESIARLLANPGSVATLRAIHSMRRLAAFIFSLALLLAPASAATKKPATSKSSKTSKSTSSKSSRTTSPAKPESPGVARPFAVDDDDPSVFPVVAAQSVILCDAATGRVLYEKNPDQVRAVASTQKLLTALVVAEAGDLSRKGDGDAGSMPFAIRRS